MIKGFFGMMCGVGVMVAMATGAAAQTASEAKAQTKSAAKSTANALTDAEITAAVKTKLLADKDVGGLKIDVDTSHGVVTLTGPVSTAAERSTALKLARQTKGVTKVVSKLTTEKK